MGDRVCIIGGSTPNRDHFPFPVPDAASAVGPQTSWPFALDINRACRWFYIVKKWRFFMQFNYSTQRGPDPPAPPHTGIGSIQFDFIPNVLVDTDPATPTRESDLVLPRFSNRCIFELLFDGTVNIIPDVPDPFTVSGETGSSSYNDGSGEFLIAGELYFDCSSQVWDSGNIMPLFALRMDTIEADGMYLATDETTTGDTGGATVKVDSSQSPLVSTDLLANADLGGVTTVITFEDDITIDPIEFWPYKTKAGLPVYDTSDGSILNAPD